MTILRHLLDMWREMKNLTLQRQNQINANFRKRPAGLLSDAEMTAVEQNRQDLLHGQASAKVEQSCPGPRPTLPLYITMATSNKVSLQNDIQQSNKYCSY
jgi:hypothetical protein